MSPEPQLIRKPLRFERNFVQLPNTWLRDERLSFRARGLLALLMSHTVGFKVTLAALASTSPTEGIDAVRVAVQQLEQHGYLKRVLLQGKGGKYEGTTWEICDPFDTGNLALFTALDNPTTVAPQPVDNSVTALDNPTPTALDNPTPIRTLVKNTKSLRDGPVHKPATVAREGIVAGSDKSIKDASGGSLRDAGAIGNVFNIGSSLRSAGIPRAEICRGRAGIKPHDFNPLSGWCEHCETRQPTEQINYQTGEVT